MRNPGDGAESVRPARVQGGVDQTDYRPLLVSPEGYLVVTGAGAEPAATALKIADGQVVGRFAVVTEGGEVKVVVTDMGDDDSEPPQGSGALGWLRSLHTRLGSTPAVDVSDRPDRALGEVVVVNPTADPETGLAKDASLGTDGADPPVVAGTGVRGWLRAVYERLGSTLAVSAEELPLPSGAASEASVQALLAEHRARHDTVNALATVPTSTTFTTVVSFTPTDAVTVVGYGSDLNGFTPVTFRYRLVTGPDATPLVKDMEQVGAANNSWRPLRVSVAAGTRVAVQVIHNEALPQDFRATINYREVP